MEKLANNSSLDYWKMSNMDIIENMSVIQSSGWWEADWFRDCDCNDCDCQTDCRPKPQK